MRPAFYILIDLSLYGPKQRALNRDRNDITVGIASERKAYNITI